MAAPKKKVVARERAAPEVGVAAFTVVLEDIHAQFKVFGEALHGIRENVVDLGHRLDRVEGEIIFLKAATLENTREIKELKVTVKDLQVTVLRIETTLERKVDRGEMVELVDHAVERALARR